MGKLTEWVEGLALTLGAPGLYLVAFLDSSFLSLPEITDILVVWMVTQNHDRMILYVVAATLGSLTGCLVMYFVGRKGGEALLRKRFASATVDRAMAAFERLRRAGRAHPGHSAAAGAVQDLSSCFQASPGSAWRSS